MKLRLLVITVFLLCAGLLLCLSRTVGDQPPQAVLPVESSRSDLAACGETKHVQAATYDNFATAAEQEQLTAAATLFHALAHSERVQEINCAAAVQRLGGRYTPPRKVILLRGYTAQNIDYSIGQEYSLHQRYGGTRIDQALHHGNRYVARVLIWTSGSDLRHIELLEQYRYGVRAQGYVVCPACGNIFTQELCAHYCPICLTHARQFVRFE